MTMPEATWLFSWTLWDEVDMLAAVSCSVSVVGFEGAVVDKYYSCVLLQILEKLGEIAGLLMTSNGFEIRKD